VLKLGLMVACFVGFTALGVWWAAPPGDVLARFASELAALPLGNLLVLGALAIAAIVTEMYRLMVFGRVVGAKIDARAAFDASIANDLFTWISPFGLLGEPASIWFMTRRGVPAEAALAISFGKFATSFALFIGLAAILFAAGFGPAVADWAMISIGLTIAFGAVLIGSFLVGAMRPAFAHRVIDQIRGGSLEPTEGAIRRLRWRLAGLLARSLDRLAMFRTAGVRGWLAIIGSHLLYYASYIGLFAALAWTFEARSVAEMVPVSIVYQAFAYIAPAPGIPEAGANVFFDGLIPGGNALIVVILFRGLTAYLQVLLGLVYLPVRTVADGILTRPARR
jgi:hypothetical protein